MPFVPIVVSPPKQPEALPSWVEASFVFRFKCGLIKAVDAWKYGCLYLHVTLPDEKKQCFVLTHGPSKLAIVRVKNHEDAVKIAEFLWKNYKAVFSAEDVDRKLLPPDIVKWLHECNRIYALSDMIDIGNGAEA